MRPAAVLTGCSPKRRPVVSARLLWATGPLRWAALTTCRGRHSGRSVNRMCVGLGPRVPPVVLRITVTAPTCRTHQRGLYTQQGVQPFAPGRQGTLRRSDQTKHYWEALAIPVDNHQGTALVPFDVIRSCIIVLDVTAMEGHDLS
jgi:hypothetical protein